MLSSQKILISSLIASILIFSSSVCFSQTEPIVTNEKINSSLLNILETFPADAMLPIVVYFQNPIPPEDLLKEVEGMNHLERRRYVIERLSRHLEYIAFNAVGWIEHAADRGEAERVYSLWVAHAYLMNLRADRIPVLAEFPEVAQIAYDRPLTRDMILDTGSGYEQDGIDMGSVPVLETEEISWGVEDIGATELWSSGYYGRGIIVGVIDTGCYITHSDLVNQIWVNEDEVPDNLLDDDNNGFRDDVHGWNFVNNNNNLTDVDGHGTQCAGILVGDGTGGDTTGIAPDAQLMILRIYDLETSSEARNWQAVQYAIENGARVLSASLSYKYNNDPDYPAYATHRTVHANSLAAGMIQSNSVGNTGRDLVTYPIPWSVAAPANCPPPWLPPAQTLIGGLTDILGCGAFLSNHAIDSYSAYGPSEWYRVDFPLAFRDYPWQNGAFLGLLKPDVAAPSGVRSTNRNGGYRTFSNTSAANPHLGGALTLLRSIHQQATSAQIAEAVMMCALEAGAPGHDNRFGNGMLRVNAAHEYLDEMITYGGLRGEVPANSELSLNNGEVRGWSDEGGELLIPRILPGVYLVALLVNGELASTWDDIEIIENEVTELPTYPALTVPLQANYFELVSTYAQPHDLNARVVFGGINGLEIVYQNNGGIFIPPHINTIGDIDVTNGYQIFCNTASEWTVESQLVDYHRQYSITAGLWNWVGYPFVSAVPINVALSDIENSVVIVMTDDGRLWIPEIPLNTLGNMQPGEGYMVIVNENVTFEYNSGDLLAAALERPTSFQAANYGESAPYNNFPRPTGLPYAILVRLTDALKSFQPAVIEVYDGQLLVGRSIVFEESAVTPVIAWGGSEKYGLAGFKKGNTITVMAKSADGTPLSHYSDDRTTFCDGAYAEVLLDAAGTVPLDNSALPESFAVHSAYPNPFNSTLTVPFSLPVSGVVGFTVFNLFGQQVLDDIRYYEAGNHQWSFDTEKSSSSLSSGVYFLKVDFRGQKMVQKVLLLE